MRGCNNGRGSCRNGQNVVGGVGPSSVVVDVLACDAKPDKFFFLKKKKINKQTSVVSIPFP